MILCHLTDDDGKTGIEQNGFGRSSPRDSQGKTWFWDCEQTARQEAEPWHRWLILVLIPDDIAAQHRGRLDPEDPDSDPYLTTYLLPFEVANQYRPFEFKRLRPTPHRG